MRVEGAFAQLFEQFVATECLPDSLVGSACEIRLAGGRHDFIVPGQCGVRLVVRGEQLFQAPTQGAVRAAGGLKKSHPLGNRPFEGEREQRAFPFRAGRQG